MNKWYHCIVFHMLDMVNAWQLYRKDPVPDARECLSPTVGLQNPLVVTILSDQSVICSVSCHISVPVQFAWNLNRPGECFPKATSQLWSQIPSLSALFNKIIFLEKKSGFYGTFHECILLPYDNNLPTTPL